MRRSLLICVLMMTLSLSACGGGGGGSEAEELALTIRGEYLAMTSCAAQAVVTADYGQRVYRYELSAAVNGRGSPPHPDRAGDGGRPDGPDRRG